MVILHPSNWHEQAAHAFMAQAATSSVYLVEFFGPQIDVKGMQFLGFGFGVFLGWFKQSDMNGLVYLVQVSVFLGRWGLIFRKLFRKQESKRNGFWRLMLDCFISSSSQKQRCDDGENGFEERKREREEQLTFHTKQLFSIRNK